MDYYDKANRSDEPQKLHKSNEKYKIILLGSASVGKTNLLKVLVDQHNGFSHLLQPTLAPEFAQITLPHPDGSKDKVITAVVWDTAGQEKYRSLAKTHYRRADGAILVYDVSNDSSFAEVGEYLGELDEHSGETLSAVTLVENKIDLLPHSEQFKEVTPATLPEDVSLPETQVFVDSKNIEAYKMKNPGLMFAKVTAKHNDSAYRWGGVRIQDVLSSLVAEIYHQKKGLCNDQGRFCLIDDEEEPQQSYFSLLSPSVFSSSPSVCW